MKDITLFLRFLKEMKTPSSAHNFDDNTNINNEGLDSDTPTTQKMSAKVSTAPENESSSLGFFELFRFADTVDRILIAIGTVSALAVGVALQSFVLIWGRMTDAFALGGDAMVEETLEAFLLFIFIGIGAFFAGWIMFFCWIVSGERQAITCRKKYFESLLRQDIGWYDVINQSEITSKFMLDCNSFSGAIGEKPTVIITNIAIFISGFAIAFSTGWLLSLVVSISIPVLGLAFYFYVKVSNDQAQKFEEDYAVAGGMSQQALSSIKTIKQLNGEQYEQQKYFESLKDVTQKALKHSRFYGLILGLLYFVTFSSYGLALWFGSHCIMQSDICNEENSGQRYSAGDIQIVFESLFMIGLNMGQIAPAVKKITEGKQAAKRIFAIIDRKPSILNDPSAIKLESFKGVIKFENVSFAYPKYKDKKILDNVSLEFDGLNSALVGESGCGKSTIFQLIMRFYDPDEGQITIDGVDIRRVQLNSLRQSIGYVGQEPVLFSGSIKDNLLLAKPEATQTEIEQALKMAEAYDFIQSLKEKIDTNVGLVGSQLSGGQKQRIAIARALLRNPRILLLDEATSALDRKNEKLIQSTLNKISAKKTTLTIAHRVKTIMNSNMIYVFEKGKVIEKGKFQDLNRYKGVSKEELERVSKEELERVSKQELQRVSQQELQRESKKKTLAKMETSRLNLPSFKTKVIKVFLPAKRPSQKKSQNQQLNCQLSDRPFAKQCLNLVEEVGENPNQTNGYPSDIGIENQQKGSFRRILTYASQHKKIFLLGLCLCFISGISFPVFSIFLSQLLVLFLEFEDNEANRQNLRDKSNLYSILFVVVGAIALFSNIGSFSIFPYIGQSVTRKLRVDAFRKMLRMPIPWFDHPENSPGNLSTGLEVDCQNVNNMGSNYISIMFENIVIIVAGIVIALIFEWKTALIAASLIPLMVLSGFAQMASSSNYSEKKDIIYKQSSSVISETINNIRTVSSFNCSAVILQKYAETLDKQNAIIKRNSIVYGLMFGISQSLMFISLGLVFYVGSLFVRNGTAEVNNVFIAAYSILFSAMTVGNNAYYLPNLASGKQSALALFKILDGEDQDQKQIRQNSKLLKTGIKGEIELRNIEFKYPTRDEFIFKDFNLKIKHGDKVAFVGQSGCGKSTILQLLQSFYEPSRGQILIDGVNIKDYEVHYLRSCLGVVSQQPVLFNGAFRENIVYNQKQLTQEDLIRAAQEAKAYDFISGSEKIGDKPSSQQSDKIGNENQDAKIGFEKNVGVRGCHISGGQKQRVAIARVIARNPKILLLDEATSALDSENEAKVQLSLDRIMKGRTTVSVAHRISTIVNSDQINVFERGEIVEKGQYAELVSQKGQFYKLEKGLATL